MEKNKDESMKITITRNTEGWWNSLTEEERQEYFNMYYKDMERLDLLRVMNIDELDSTDIEEIYWNYYL